MGIQINMTSRLVILLLVVSYGFAFPQHQDPNWNEVETPVEEDFLPVPKSFEEFDGQETEGENEIGCEEDLIKIPEPTAPAPEPTTEEVCVDPLPVKVTPPAVDHSCEMEWDDWTLCQNDGIQITCGSKGKKSRSRICDCKP